MASSNIFYLDSFVEALNRYLPGDPQLTQGLAVFSTEGRWSWSLKRQKWAVTYNLPEEAQQIIAYRTGWRKKRDVASALYLPNNELVISVNDNINLGLDIQVPRQRMTFRYQGGNLSFYQTTLPENFPHPTLALREGKWKYVRTVSRPQIQGSNPTSFSTHYSSAKPLKQHQ